MLSNFTKITLMLLIIFNIKDINLISHENKTNEVSIIKVKNCYRICNEK